MDFDLEESDDEEPSDFELDEPLDEDESEPLDESDEDDDVLDVDAELFDPRESVL